MLQKLSKSRGGFTLVEIMIVVAIIALLAAIAVPNFLRARKRSQATTVLNDLRLVDSAKDQYAIEKNLASGTPTAAQLAPYFKNGSRLYNTAAAGSITDIFGAAITINDMSTLPSVPSATKTALNDVVDNDFWSPYQ
ncbi:MAG: prepilin-type N-terminal cleavage/methylation domain-containing protein [Pirellulaceae bacterium]|nr:prepilin-type N-terminal cleavage/methylation domain-containing protein [Pirellulaceae bacterium]